MENLYFWKRNLKATPNPEINSGQAIPKGEEHYLVPK